MLPWALLNKFKKDLYVFSKKPIYIHTVSDSTSSPCPLNRHIWESITLYLSPIEILNLSLTSKSWSEILIPILYFAPQLHSFDVFKRFLNTLCTIETYFPYTKFIIQLHIPCSVSDNLLMGDLDTLLSLVCNLEEFSISNQTVSNTLLSTLSTHVVRLRKLELIFCPISNNFISKLLLGCTQLQYLDLSCTNTSLDHLPILLSHAPRLSTLHMNGIREGTLDFWPQEHQHHDALEILSLSQTNISNQGLLLTSLCCRNLRQLNLQSLPTITDQGISLMVPYLKKLKSLDVSWNINLTDASLYALSVLYLEYLYIYSCPNMSLTGVKKLVKGCASLKHLGLEKSKFK